MDKIAFSGAGVSAASLIITSNYPDASTSVAQIGSQADIIHQNTINSFDSYIPYLIFIFIIISIIALFFLKKK